MDAARDVQPRPAPKGAHPVKHEWITPLTKAGRAGASNPVLSPGGPPSPCLGSYQDTDGGHEQTPCTPSPSRVSPDAGVQEAQ